ncbi:MAG: RND transporter [Candidatus Latescibacterota bacterium]
MPILGLLVAALLLGLAPFQPRPHLLEKLNMLLAGELTRLLDIFDLVFHGAPSLLLIIRLLRKATNDSTEGLCCMNPFLK